jgi:hypothetical protein
VASLVTNILATFALVKNYKITGNSTSTEAREKRSTNIGILRILENI